MVSVRQSLCFILHICCFLYCIVTFESIFQFVYFVTLNDDKCFDFYLHCFIQCCFKECILCCTEHFMLLEATLIFSKFENYPIRLFVVCCFYVSDWSLLRPKQG